MEIAYFCFKVVVYMYVNKTSCPMRIRYQDLTDYLIRCNEISPKLNFYFDNFGLELHVSLIWLL